MLHIYSQHNGLCARHSFPISTGSTVVEADQPQKDRRGFPHFHESPISLALKDCSGASPFPVSLFKPHPANVTLMLRATVYPQVPRVKKQPGEQVLVHTEAERQEGLRPQLDHSLGKSFTTELQA